MKKLGRSNDERTKHLHDIDPSLCFGPCHVTVGCEYFCQAVQMNLKASNLLFETGIDTIGRNDRSKATSVMYLIELDDIIDIHNIIAEVDEEQEDVQNGIVLLLSNHKACLISAIQVPTCLKVIVDSWQTHFMRSTARLHRPRAVDVANQGINAARSYYNQFITALRDCPNIDELIILLIEYSKEVISNQTLKIITFETKEVITYLLRVWKALLLRSPEWPLFKEDMKWRQLAPTETKKRTVLYSALKSANNDTIDSELLQDEYNQYLLTITGNRMAILATIAQTLSSVFFGSQLINYRSEGVTSDIAENVLGLSSWMTVLCIDTLPLIANAICLPDNVLQAQLQKAAELKPSQTPRTSLISLMGMGGGSFRVAPFSPAKIPLKALGADKEAIDAIPQLHKDVRNRQALLLFEILRIIDNERAFLLLHSNMNSKTNVLYSLPNYLINHNHTDSIEVQRLRYLVRQGQQQIDNRKHVQLLNALKLSSVTDYIGQVTNWNDPLEMWVNMLQESLDQLLSNQNIRLQKGVTVSAPSLASSRAPSFRSMDSNVYDGNAYDGRENRLCSPIIRIFYLCHILHFVAMDSAHVREVLGKDMTTHWAAIMSIFQIMCPHQPSSIGTKSPNSGAATGSPRHQSNDGYSSPVRKLSRRDSRQTILRNVLTSSLSRMLSNRSINSVASTGISEQATRPQWPAGDNTEVQARGAPIIDNVRTSTAFSCGSVPRHGLSIAAWRLLIICRLRCEALVFDVLKLPVAQMLSSREDVDFEQEQEQYDDDEDDDLVQLPPLYPRQKPSEMQESSSLSLETNELIPTVTDDGADPLQSPLPERNRGRTLSTSDDPQGIAIQDDVPPLQSPIYSESPTATKKRVRML